MRLFSSTAVSAQTASMISFFRDDLSAAGDQHQKRLERFRGDGDLLAATVKPAREQVGSESAEFIDHANALLVHISQ